MERKRFSWLLNAVILTAFIAIGGFLGHSILILRSALRSGSQYQVLPDQSILRLDFHFYSFGWGLLLARKARRPNGKSAGAAEDRCGKRYDVERCPSNNASRVDSRDESIS